MKIAAIIVRVLLGILFLFGSVVYFFNLFPQPVLPEGALKTFNEGMKASGYLMTAIKTIELICGLALVSGFFVPLAVVVIFPISLNIFLVHLNIAPDGIPVGTFVLVANLFLAYYYKESYKPLFKAK